MGRKYIPMAFAWVSSHTSVWYATAKNYADYLFADEGA